MGNRCLNCRYWDTNETIDSWGVCMSDNVVIMVKADIPYDMDDKELVTVVYYKDYCCVYYDRFQEGD